MTTHKSERLGQSNGRSAQHSMLQILAAVCCLALLGGQRAAAVGFRMPNQDPDGIARGNAFVATADNPSAIYYNPAGITQLEGDQFSLGLYLISADSDYKSSAGAKAHTDKEVQAVPQLHYVHSIDDTDFTLGLGVYAPYGLSLDWGNPPFAAIAQRGKLLYATVNPVVAWKVLPSLSLAAGPTFNYVDVDLKNASFDFTGDDICAGFKLGVLWQPHDQWSFGVNYHSATEVELSGRSTVPAFALGKASTTAGAHFPQFVTGGVSFRPTPDWNLEFNLDWTDWDNVDRITFKRSDGVNVPFPFNYKSGFMYCFGVTRKLGEKYHVSVGYIFAENSSPEQYFNPIVPDADLHLASVGFSRRGEKWDWAVGYHFALNPEREVNSASSPLANGTYKTFNNALNFSVTYKF